MKNMDIPKCPRVFGFCRNYPSYDSFFLKLNFIGGFRLERATLKFTLSNNFFDRKIWPKFYFDMPIYRCVYFLDITTE